MSILALVIILVLLGLGCWFINSKTPLSQGWKTAINVVIIITAIVLCLVAFGVWDEIRGVKVPHI